MRCDVSSHSEQTNRTARSITKRYFQQANGGIVEWWCYRASPFGVYERASACDLSRIAIAFANFLSGMDACLYSHASFAWSLMCIMSTTRAAAPVPSRFASLRAAAWRAERLAYEVCVSTCWSHTRFGSNRTGPGRNSLTFEVGRGKSRGLRIWITPFAIFCTIRRFPVLPHCLLNVLPNG